jgi:cell division protein FtsI (penicillin-binding protein 3)
MSLVQGAIFALFVILAGRLVYVQGVIATDLQGKADRQFRSQTSFQSNRFNILDRFGNALVETVKVVSIYVDPKMVEDKKGLSLLLAKKLDLDADALKSQMDKTKGSFMWVKRKVGPQVVQDLKGHRVRGLGFKAEWRRNYPMGPLASHLLGLVGMDGVGLSGIEMCFDPVLNPKAAPKNYHGEILPRGHIKLTVDGQIQRIAEKELAWGVNKTEAKRGMVVIQNPQTGEVLAMAAWPPLALNPDGTSSADDLRIPPVGDVFEPGSTFKIVPAAAAIEEEVFEPDEIFDGEKGAWPVADITIHDQHPHDQMNFEDIWIHSSNVGAAKIGERLGSQRLYQYARAFGFGVFPGCGLAGEAKGTLRHPRRWSGVSKHVISFGQEVGVTALQLVGAYSAIANGGKLMEPKVISSINSDDHNILWRDKPDMVRRVISEDGAHQLRDVLVKVVENGTGYRAKLKWYGRYQVAGKTGTAQKFDREQGQYHNDLSLISFCGFFPAPDPRYTIVVILDEPEGRRWGGVDAAPIFQRIADQLAPGIQI